MRELTVYEIDVLQLLSSRLPEGERNALIEIPELAEHLSYASTDEVELTLQMLDARGLIKFTPPVIAGMAGIVARPDVEQKLAPIRRRPRRSRARSRTPRGA